EALRRLALDGRLDGGTDVLDRGDLAPEVDGREELLAATGQRLHEIAVHAGEQPVHHFHDSDATTEGGIDLTHLEADVAAAHHEQVLGDLRHLECPRRIHDAVAADGEAGRHHRRRARGHDGVLEAHHLRLLAADADAPRVLEGAAPSDDNHALGLGDRGEPARELAHHALGLPLAHRIERDARLAEVDAELLGALRLAEHGGHVQERLGRDAALEEAGAAQTMAGVDHHRLEAELPAAEGGRVAAPTAAQPRHAPLGAHITHHHGATTPRRAARALPGAG